MNRRGSVDTMTIAAILAVLGLTSAATPRGVVRAAFELPPPTGRYAVGTTAWRVTDSSRHETFTTSGEFRQVEVLAWYPAAAPRSGGLAAYLREGLAEVRSFAKLFGAAETVFDGLAEVRTHAGLDAAPAVTPRKFPVLLFSHGYTSIPSAYTALLEDLASHGYAVLSIVHPYEATAATLADGRVVSLLDNAGTPLPAIRDVFGEWGTEDETMGAVTRATDAAEQIRLLRGYLAGLRRTDLALRRWVDDTKLVIDRLSNVPPKSSTSAALACSAIPWGASRQGSSVSRIAVAGRG